MIAWRATSLNAMFCADRFGAAAMTSAWRMRSGYRIAHGSACMPPRLPPITAANCRDAEAVGQPRLRVDPVLDRDQRKVAPQGLPVAGSIDCGPVEPKQLPRLFTPMTKKRSVSSGLPGPIMLSHQPTLSGSSA